MDTQKIKELIVQKIKNSTETLVQSNHPRIKISDFSNAIHQKKIEDIYFFYNPIYKIVS